MKQDVFLSEVFLIISHSDVQTSWYEIIEEFTKKSLQDIQKLVSESIEVFNNILPDLTEAEKRIVNAQKFGIADLVIKQFFDESEDVLNQSEQKQFIDLLTKVLKSAPKREQNKIFKGSNNLKEALYLHNDDARRVKLKA